MKKVFLLLAAVLLSMSAMAQVKFGVKAGFDMSHFWGKDPKRTLTPNYQFGALMEYKFNDKLAISPEVVFAAQGSRSNGDTYAVNYINVPVLLKYYVAPSFAIDLGPQVGFNVYSSLNGNSIKYKTKSIDFGIGLGGTYNLTEHAFLQARYTLGVTNVYDGGADIKNGNAQVSFGWKF